MYNYFKNGIYFMINAGKTDWKGRSENECKKDVASENSTE